MIDDATSKRQARLSTDQHLIIKTFLIAARFTKAVFIVECGCLYVAGLPGFISTSTSTCEALGVVFPSFAFCAMSRTIS